MCSQIKSEETVFFNNLLKFPKPGLEVQGCFSSITLLCASGAFLLGVRVTLALTLI